MLNDPGARATQRIWNVTMLIAGMQDTPKVVEGLTTITPDTRELGAVPPTAVQAMIENGIDRSNASATDRKRAKAQMGARRQQPQRASSI